jgi:5-methylcytosine-specific restriction endonuclease McrA
MPVRAPKTKSKAAAKRARKQSAARAEWTAKFRDVCKPLHRQFTAKAVQRILNRITACKRGLLIRSKKHGVECSITTDEIAKLILDAYGKPCRFCGRILTIQNLVFDHVYPISKGGSSNVDNLAVICRSCNGRKGSLIQEEFEELLRWLATMPSDFANNILIRLSGGKC